MTHALLAGFSPPRRGLYIVSKKYQPNKFSAFHLANHIVPHSYISLESALSYYGWIPERVVTITSIISEGRNRSFQNSLGEYLYYFIPVNNYMFLTDVNRHTSDDNQSFFIASPLRALADLFYVKKIIYPGIEYLTKSLRIEEEDLAEIETQKIEILKSVYRSKRVLFFLNKLQQELKYYV